MTQHKVISEDSLSAMDEISKVLGKDAVILKTTKVNGKIEILGSNNIEDIASSNAKKIVKQKSHFSHLFSNHNLEQKIQSRKVNNILDEEKLNQNEHTKKPTMSPKLQLLHIGCTSPTNTARLSCQFVLQGFVAQC